MASPRPTRYAPRSQAILAIVPVAIPIVRGRGWSRQPEPRASRARSRNSQMSRITKPSSAGADANLALSRLRLR